MKVDDRKERVVRCPICGKKVAWRDNPYRPFCSEKCKLVDLGNWLDEVYSISEDSKKRE